MVSEHWWLTLRARPGCVHVDASLASTYRLCIARYYRQLRRRDNNSPFISALWYKHRYKRKLRRCLIAWRSSPAITATVVQAEVGLLLLNKRLRRTKTVLYVNDMYCARSRHLKNSMHCVVTLAPHAICLSTTCLYTTVVTSRVTTLWCLQMGSVITCCGYKKHSCVHWVWHVGKGKALLRALDMTCGQG